MYKVYAISDIGIEREENQDGFYVDGIVSVGERHREVYYESNANYIHIAVCDGVGSTEYARYSVQKSLQFIRENHFVFTEYDVDKYIHDLNRFVYKSAHMDKKEDCATTIVGLVIREGIAFSYNIGDSVLYTINNGYLEKHSIDDAGMAALAFGTRFGEIDNDNKPPLFQSIGTKEDIDLVHVKKLINENAYLLSTDGVFDMLGIDEVEKTIGESNSLQEISQMLIKKANSNGGYDNSTVVLVMDEREE